MPRNSPYLGVSIGKDWLIEPADLDGQKLFAILIEEMLRGPSPKCRIESGGGDWVCRHLVPPYVLFEWARKLPPPLDELRAALNMPVPPASWPSYLHEDNRWDVIRSGPFRFAVEQALTRGQYFNIRTPGRLMNVLAAVTQTFLERNAGKNENLKLARALYNEAAQHEARNRESERARQYVTRQYEGCGGQPPTGQQDNTVRSDPSGLLPPTEEHKRSKPLAQRPEPWPPFPDRLDEAGLSQLSTDCYRITWASHRGPSFAHKEENQDAVHVRIDERRIYFALADGVSTSFGSRFAAALAAYRYCELLHARGSTEMTADSAVMEAAAETQGMLDEMLDFLIDNPKAPEWNVVKGESRLENAVISRLVENTKTPKNRFWGPAFATTLIGGVLDQQTRTSRLTVLRIGDGVVERALNTGDVVTVLGMDPEQTEITASMSPGPLSAKAIAAAKPTTLDITHSDGLLISSDGLTRGTDRPILSLLREIASNPTIGTGGDSSRSAIELLRLACNYADDQFSRDEKRQLFGDNLSIVVISPIRRR